MVDLNPKIPVIMLSIKVSETLIKSQGLLDGIKKKQLNHMLLISSILLIKRMKLKMQ